MPDEHNGNKAQPRSGQLQIYFMAIKYHSIKISRSFRGDVVCLSKKENPGKSRPL